MKELRERTVRVLLNVVYFGLRQQLRLFFSPPPGGCGRCLNWGRGWERFIPQGHAAGLRLSFSAILEPVEVREILVAELWVQVSAVSSTVCLGRALVQLGGCASHWFLWSPATGRTGLRRCRTDCAGSRTPGEWALPSSVLLPEP